MLNLIELEHRQTTPKLARKQEQATGINGNSTRTTDSYKEKSGENQRTILTQQRTQDVCENSKIQQNVKLN